MKIIASGFKSFDNKSWTEGQQETVTVSNPQIKETDILLTGLNIAGATGDKFGLRFTMANGSLTGYCSPTMTIPNATVSFGI